jgi:hypothetical protein
MNQNCKITMIHRDCGGLVFHDSMYKGESFIDLACIICGRRWHVTRSNALARLITDGCK